MFRKILICSDTSPASDLLVRCAGELKTIGLEEAVLAHVLQPAYPAAHEGLLAGQKETLVRMGIKAITETPLAHDPAEALAELAEKHDVSVVFIGSHGKGIVRTALLGSVAMGLLRQVARPVLLIRVTLPEEGKCRAVCSTMFARVLFATDFSAAAEQALNYLGKIAADTGCPVTVLHVLEKEKAGEEDAQRILEGARFLIESKKRRLEAMGASAVDIRLESGEPAKAILAQADEGEYSLIVMGSPGKGFVKGVLMGSVSTEVTRHTALPVLLIPAVR